MMPVIRVNDATFIDLKSISTWLGTKTPSETIDRLVRKEMEELGLERDQGEEVSGISGQADRLLFEKAPGLSFTRILSASVMGKKTDKMNWNGLLLKVIDLVGARGLAGQRLAEELQVPTRAYEYVNDGYKYHPELGVSIQGQSTPDAWREISRLAQKFHIPVEVEFQWRDNEKAQHPGRIGIVKAGH